MGINRLKGYFGTNVGKGKTGMLKNIIQSRNETPSKHPSGFLPINIKVVETKLQGRHAAVHHCPRERESKS